MKILHLSDILADSSEFKVERVLQHFREVVGSIKFDYIIVCGNLTRDGERSSFEQAGQFLNRLSTDVLTDQSRLFRIMIVPGTNDLCSQSDGKLDSREFQNFYDTFFSQEITRGRIPAFQYGRALLRELKDLRFVGAYYQNFSQQGLISPLQDLDDLIAETVSQLCPLPYCTRRPTVLVSPGTPVLVWDERSGLQGSNLSSLLENNLKVALHLFGSGSVVQIPPEPFAFNHLSLGTGPRTPGGSWPLRMNHVEIQDGFLSQDQSEQNITIDVYRKLNSTQGWQRANLSLSNPSFNGGMPNHAIRQASNRLITTVVLNQIHTILCESRPGMVLLKGFPGCGKKKLLKRIVKWAIKSMQSP
jgi:hypothetical protein